MSTTETISWPDLGAGLYDRLTGRGAEITYQFNDLEILVPSSTAPTAGHARWKLSGAITIRTRDTKV